MIEAGVQTRSTPYAAGLPRFDPVSTGVALQGCKVSGAAGSMGAGGP